MEDSVHGRQGTPGSDEVRQWCESCKDDGNTIEAIGFCKVCEEYMCRECCQVHCKPRKMKDHVIVPIGKEDIMTERESDMGKKTGSQDGNENATEDHIFNKSGRFVTKCVDECPVHPEKIIEYFCKTHEQLCCSACNTINHKSCGDVVYIPDSVTGLADSDEILQLTKNLKAIKDSLSYNETCIKTNLEATETINEDTKKQNATLQREIFELVERKKAELDSESNKKFNHDSKMMKDLREKCSKVMTDLEEITTKLNTVKESGQLCELFVNMKRTKITAGLLEDRVHEIELKNNIERYAYEPNSKLVDLKNTLDNMGKLIPEHSQKSLVSHIKYIDVASTDDKHVSKCLISGLAIVSERYIVATDMENSSSKLIDRTQEKLVHTLQLQSAPRDVCKVTDEEVVLTLPERKKLQFVSVSADGKLSSKREVDVGGQCYGIVCSRKELFVSFIPSLFIQTSKIKVLDMNGQVLKTLTQKLLGSPGYLALSYDQRTLYISDWGNSTVTSMSTEGKVIAIYYSENLKMPHGIVCTRGGSVFVCGRQSRNIHHLSANCETVQVLVNAENGLVEPFSVAYSDNEHKLYVGMNNCINVFSVI